MTDLKARLRSHLTEVIRERDAYLATAGHFFVRQYIRSQLGNWGTVETHEFTEQGMTLENLILNLPGTSIHQSPILIGAHYDTVPGSPGADDNATGVVALLELARLLTETPAKYPIRLVAFDLEETSYDKAGSTRYAQTLQQPIRLMLSLEMLGYCDRTPNSQRYPIDLLKWFYPDQGDFIALIGNLKSIPDLIHLSYHLRQAGIACQFLPVPNRGQLLPDTRRSDHAPFWDRGDRALMVTDTAHLRNPNYHKPSDRLETLDLDFLTGICQGLAAGICSL